MARSVAKLKMGFYPLPESEGANLRQLLSFTGPASVVDPCVGQGVALNLIAQGADVRRYGVELDAERALAASATGIETIQGNTFDAVAKPESFSLLYLNPPYDSEIGSIGNSRMERLFLEHTFRWLVMEGVLVLVVPFERLHECAGVLSSHFTKLNIFRMTDEESVRFRQIAVLGVRSNVRGAAVEQTSASFSASASTEVFRSCRSWRRMPMSRIECRLQAKRRSVIAACPTTCSKTCCRTPARGCRLCRFWRRAKTQPPGGRSRRCMEATSGCSARRAC